MGTFAGATATIAFSLVLTTILAIFALWKETVPLFLIGGMSAVATAFVWGAQGWSLFGSSAALAGGAILLAFGITLLGYAIYRQFWEKPSKVGSDESEDET